MVFFVREFLHGAGRSQRYAQRASPLVVEVEERRGARSATTRLCGGLLATAVKPHGYHPGEQKKKSRDWLMASIDHAIWYHRPFRADEWLLYDSHSMSTSNSRGLARASIYDIHGSLVATCIQEGLVRVKAD